MALRLAAAATAVVVEGLEAAVVHPARDQDAVAALVLPARELGLRTDEGALSFVTTICYSYRDSQYKRE